MKAITVIEDDDGSTFLTGSNIEDVGETVALLHKGLGQIARSAVLKLDGRADGDD